MNSKHRMTKKELISLVMQEIEHTDIFDQNISKQKIREKFEKEIENIKYEELPSGVGGQWDKETKTVFLSIEPMDELQTKLICVHELLHALSTQGDRSGFLETIHGYQIKGRSLNEGATQYLTEKITGATQPNSYDKEKKFYQLMTGFVDEKHFIKDYIKGGNTVEREFAKRYGDEVLKKYLTAKCLLDKWDVNTYICQTQELEEKEKQKLEIINKKIEFVLNTLIKQMSEIQLNKLKEDPGKRAVFLTKLQIYAGEKLENIDITSELEKVENEIDEQINKYVIEGKQREKNEKDGRNLENEESKKEKLIQEFITLLNKENFLIEAMSIEQIKEKLENTIKEVKYTKQLELPGYWDIKNKKIIINSNKENKNDIIHIILHVLSSKENKSQIHTLKNNENGKGLNEGITQILVEKISSKKSNTYQKEKSVYKLLTGFVDEKYFLQDYLNGTNTVDEQFIQNYGEEMYKLYLCNKTLLDKYNIANKKTNNRTKDIVDKKIDEVLEKMINNKLHILKQKGDVFKTLGFLSIVSDYSQNIIGKMNVKDKINETKKLVDNRWIVMLSDYKNVGEIEEKTQELINNETNSVTISQINNQTKKVEETILNKSENNVQEK